MAVDSEHPSSHSELGALRQEVLELKAGTDGLAAQVATLSVALQMLGELQRSQKATAKRVELAVESADEQHQLAEQLLLTIEGKPDRVEMRRTAKRTALAGAVIVVLTGGGGLVLHQQAGRVDSAVRSSCQTLDLALRAAIKREENLAKIDAPKTRPIHLASAATYRRELRTC